MFLSYRKYLESFAVLLGADPAVAKEDAENVVELEREIGKVGCCRELGKVGCCREQGKVGCCREQGKVGCFREQLVGWLVGFLTSSSTTRLYRGRAPRQSV